MNLRVSMPLCVSSAFSLLPFSVGFVLFCFACFYLLSLLLLLFHACFMMRDKERTWIWLGEEAGQIWKQLVEGKV